MITDARIIPRDTRLSTQICIIGGGAAGITLTRKLAERRFDCILIEGGSLYPSRRSQSLYDGDDIGIPYDLEGTRTRFFGGSTNCWGAYCAPIDDWYFEKRDWVPYGGWPIAACDMKQYYRQASELVGIDPDGFDVDLWERRLADPRAKAVRLDSEAAFTSIAQRAIERSRFGKCFRSELRQSKRATVLVNGTVIHLDVAQGGQEAQRVRVLSDPDHGFWIDAKLFILAAGGIENPRLLLLSDAVHSRGIGNQHDVVGRFFMEHPLTATGAFNFTGNHRDTRQYDSIYAYLKNRPAIFSHRLSKTIEQRERMLYSLSYTEPHFVGDNRGVDSLKCCHHFLRTLRVPDHFGRHIYNLLIGSKGVAALGCYILFGMNAAIARRELTTVIETCPNPDSRITLSNERDRLGMNQVRLDWRLTEMDRHTMKRVVETLAAEFPKSGIATIEPRPSALNGEWTANPGWLNHHMGTTRMGTNLKESVVDSNCRVHGMANLYVAGSSVFPCAPTHAPTFTLLALVLRLVDHIEQIAKQRRL